MKKTASKNKTVTATITATQVPVVAATTTTPVVRGTKVRAKNKNAVKETKVVFHKGLEHRFGFSIAAVRDTMNQLKTLGLPTDEVKKQLIQRFTDYVNRLDK